MLALSQIRLLLSFFLLLVFLLLRAFVSHCDDHHNSSSFLAGDETQAEQHFNKRQITAILQVMGVPSNGQFSHARKCGDNSVS